jgi:hypothetical protein
MKVSMSKFYKDVTGRTTANRKTTANALKRWNVPFDEAAGTTDVVDVAHLSLARAAWEVELKEQAAKTGNPAGGTLLTRMAALEQRLANMESLIDAVASAIGRIENQVNRIPKPH